MTTIAESYVKPDQENIQYPEGNVTTNQKNIQYPKDNVTTNQENIQNYAIEFVKKLTPAQKKNLKYNSLNINKEELFTDGKISEDKKNTINNAICKMLNGKNTQGGGEGSDNSIQPVPALFAVLMIPAYFFLLEKTQGNSPDIGVVDMAPFMALFLSFVTAVLKLINSQEAGSKHKKRKGKKTKKSMKHKKIMKHKKTNKKRK